MCQTISMEELDSRAYQWNRVERYMSEAEARMCGHIEYNDKYLFKPNQVMDEAVKGLLLRLEAAIGTTTGETMNKNDQDYKDLQDYNRCCNEHVKPIEVRAEMGKTKLSPPWITYVRQIKALFGKDPSIEIKYDDDTHTVNMYVHGDQKVSALRTLLPEEKTFGNVTLRIEIRHTNKLDDSILETIRTAFKDNPVFSEAVAGPGSFVYAVFTNEPAQYWNDDISDLNGVKTELVADIAREILDLPSNVMFCSVLGDDVIRAYNKGVINHV